MSKKLIYITGSDMKRLRDMIMAAKAFGQENEEYLINLESELKRAQVVKAKGIPANVVTMNSKVRLLDIKTRKEIVYWLVYPDYANDEYGKISILSPIGTVLIGYKTGDTIEGNAATGLPTLKVKEILYQPEADGRYQL